MKNTALKEGIDTMCNGWLFQSREQSAKPDIKSVVLSPATDVEEMIEQVYSKSGMGGRNQFTWLDGAN